MEMKWIVVCVLGYFLFMVVLAVGGSVDEQNKRSCRMELAKAGKSAEIIQAACK